VSNADAALLVTVFLACAVEAVEALTIVLAAGTTRHWRSTVQGTGAALIALAAIVAALGPALSQVPLTGLRLAVGALLLMFGLQWLRKAVLRASGHKELHDEAAAFGRETAAARAATARSRGVVSDWYAFTLAFKGVLLEGLEVVFIVLAFGENQHNIPVAVAGAAAAIAVVSAAGALVRAPLARVPENTMKFVVGVMLTGFGTFWAAEGTGVAWPGSDAALLVLIPAIALTAVGYVAMLRRRSRSGPVPAEPAGAAGTPGTAVEEGAGS
jgi:uncharacterized membrane protein